MAASNQAIGPSSGPIHCTQYPADKLAGHLILEDGTNTGRLERGILRPSKSRISWSVISYPCDQNTQEQPRGRGLQLWTRLLEETEGYVRALPRCHIVTLKREQVRRYVRAFRNHALIPTPSIMGRSVTAVPVVSSRFVCHMESQVPRPPHSSRETCTMFSACFL
jgi:hypothetical protein